MLTQTYPIEGIYEIFGHSSQLCVSQIQMRFVLVQIETKLCPQLGNFLLDGLDLFTPVLVQMEATSPPGNDVLFYKSLFL